MYDGDDDDCDYMKDYYDSDNMYFREQKLNEREQLLNQRDELLYRREQQLSGQHQLQQQLSGQQQPGQQQLEQQLSGQQQHQVRCTMYCVFLLYDIAPILDEYIWTALLSIKVSNCN